ncbi:ENDOPLASMIC RETICULUM MULTISPAN TRANSMEMBRANE PROTEIN-RELATED [Salix viminalis]|uniref:Man(5)GlcNAc(2)-PP-dolichol translocation protein RFT1 n=1 Tax=Salix viminalis TaxID=40686 RepID=A0A9Q0T7G1_SALVM|nr:ENDOPLASMIC RETICULUM MULTISPAN TRANSMEMBRANE PROTEIN-RELATED [Salix viminalis]
MRYNGVLLGCACIFELIAEPLFILSQNLLLLKLRLIIDSVHPSFQTNQQESLVVRLVFLPFEESSYATFSRSASGLFLFSFVLLTLF